jgi:hypothetical protein
MSLLDRHIGHHNVNKGTRTRTRAGIERPPRGRVKGRVGERVKILRRRRKRRKMKEQEQDD